MGQIKKVLFFDATSAIVCARALCDYRFDQSQERQIFGNLAGGAHVNIYLNTYDVCGSLAIHHLEAVVSAGAATYVTTATNSFNVLITGPVEEIEVVNALVCGAAKVYGFI